MKENKKAKIVDRCLAALRSGQWTREECLRRYPEMAAELQDYFALAERLALESSLALEQNEQRVGKMRMLNRLTQRADSVTNTNLPRYTWQTTKRRFAMTWVIIIATVLSVMTGTGVVYASGDALPGEALYPVKMLVEDMQLALASDAADARLLMQFSELRIREMQALAEKGRFDDVEEAAAGYQNQAQTMNQLMAEIQAENPDEATRLRSELEKQLEEQARLMQSWLDEDPQATRDQFTEQLRIMLETNTQTRLRIHEVEVIPEEPPIVEDGETATDEAAIEATEEPAGNSEQLRSAEFVQAAGDTQNATFTFRIMNAAQFGVSAELAGERYSCAAEGDLVTCSIPNAAASGVLKLYSKKDGSLLYSHAYDYDWLGEKEPGSGNGTQSQGEEDGGGQQEGQGGKGGN